LAKDSESYFKYILTIVGMVLLFSIIIYTTSGPKSMQTRVGFSDVIVRDTVDSPGGIFHSGCSGTQSLSLHSEPATCPPSLFPITATLSEAFNHVTCADTCVQNQLETLCERLIAVLGENYDILRAKGDQECRATSPCLPELLHFIPPTGEPVASCGGDPYADSQDSTPIAIIKCSVVAKGACKPFLVGPGIPNGSISEGALT